MTFGLRGITCFLFGGFLFLSTFVAYGKPVPAAYVDERVELISIVFRLAGSSEYSTSPLTGYTSDIDSYFAPYRSQPVVLLAKKLAETQDLGFDGVMQMAVSLTPPPALKPIAPFTAKNTDPRWGAENATEFSRNLASFYKDSDFHAFFKAHQALYQLAEQRFVSITDSVNMGWFSSFFSNDSSEQFHFILGLNNGGNYGPKVVLPGGKTVLYAIIGAGTPDANGDPVFNKGYLSLVIHEFSHSYINPLVERHLDQLNKLQQVYVLVEDQMKRQAYDNAQIMADESLVRACVIRYAIDSGEPRASTDRMIRDEEARGFFWTGDLVSILGEYEASRQKFPALDDYMPALALFFNSLPQRVPAEQAAFDKASAHVLSIDPIQKGALLNPSTSQLIAHFDKEMQPGQYSINYGPGGKPHFPIKGVPSFINHNKDLVIPVSLKEHGTYDFVMTSDSFRTIDGYPLAPFTVSFTTNSSQQSELNYVNR